MHAFASFAPLVGVHSARKVRCTHKRIVRACAPTSEVLASLGSEDFLERLRGVTVLTTENVASQATGISERVAALLPIAQSDQSSQVRFAALGGLAAQARDAMPAEVQSSILEVCRTILHTDSEPTCRCGAADAIGALGLHEGFNDLVKAFGEANTDWMLRLSILAGLGEMKHPEAFDLLASVIQPNGSRHDAADGQPLIMAAAVGALGDLGDPRGIPLVVELAKNADDAAVRERAAIAATQLEEEK